MTTPFLTPEDLGIKLDEDSEDVSDLDFEQAVLTESIEEFSKLLSLFLMQARAQCPQGLNPKYELRRKSGVLLCRVRISTHSQLFRVNWLQNT